MSNVSRDTFAPPSAVQLIREYDGIEFYTLGDDRCKRQVGQLNPWEVKLARTIDDNPRSSGRPTEEPRRAGPDHNHLV